MSRENRSRGTQDTPHPGALNDLVASEGGDATVSETPFSESSDVSRRLPVPDLCAGAHPGSVR
jgi:hypothetical protein